MKNMIENIKLVPCCREWSGRWGERDIPGQFWAPHKWGTKTKTTIKSKA